MNVFPEDIFPGPGLYNLPFEFRLFFRQDYTTGNSVHYHYQYETWMFGGLDIDDVTMIIKYGRVYV